MALATRLAGDAVSDQAVCPAVSVAEAVCLDYGWTLRGAINAGRIPPAVAMKKIVIKRLLDGGSRVDVIARTLGYKDHTTVVHHMRVEGW